MPQLFTNPALTPSICEGPLGCLVPAYADLLYQQGYTHQSAHLQLRFLADLSRWLDRQQFRIADITEAVLHRYFRSRHHRFRPQHDDASILKRVLHLLHTKGLLQNKVSPSINSPRQCMEDDFDRYLSQERGLSMATRVNYRPFIQRFLSEQFGARPIQFTHLRAKDVIRFVRKHAHKVSPKRAGLMVSALRSFLSICPYPMSSLLAPTPVQAAAVSRTYSRCCTLSMFCGGEVNKESLNPILISLLLPAHYSSMGMRRGTPRLPIALLRRSLLSKYPREKN